MAEEAGDEAVPAEEAEDGEPQPADDADAAAAAEPGPDDDGPQDEAAEPADGEDGEVEDADGAEDAGDAEVGEDGEEEPMVRRDRKMKRRATTSLLEAAENKKKATIESMQAVDDADDKMAAEEAKWKMPADFFYSDDDPQLAPVVEEGECPKMLGKPHKFVGFDFKRYYNLIWTGRTEFAYITGHVVVFLDVETGEQRTLHGRDTGGIGGIAMSLDMKHLAVAEKSTVTAGAPNIYIYEFKTLRLYRVLRKGTERGYAAVQFSPHSKGMHLAALGRAPDYLLSVWDWKNERLLLKCKAYGQDVFTVRWGQFPGMLTTVGTGHIRFWKMALTFTGLKLQGDIGKFGATELSDVIGFVELPDGKIVTGTEYGRLLLWEGVFVKVELMRGGPVDNPRQITGLPHEGSIDVVMLDRDTNCVVSGGSDGYLRWWPVPEIDVAEADYDNGILEYGITCAKEVRIPADGTPASITHVARNHDDTVWLVQDVRNGIVWKYDRESFDMTRVIQGHAGVVTGSMVFASYPGLVVSSGLDGTLRAWNMSAPKDQEVFSDRRGAIGGTIGSGPAGAVVPRDVPVGIVCMAPAPDAVDPERRTLSCGYEDGCVRAYSICRDGFILIQAQKPHSCAVQQIAYSPDGAFIASLGMDNSIFFFEVRGLEDHMLPLGFVQLNVKVNFMCWHSTGRLLLCLKNGTMIELCRPQTEIIDNSESYAIQLDYKVILPELPEPEESDSEEEEGAEGEGEGAEGEEAVGEDEGPKETKEERRERRKREKEEAKKKQQEEDEDEEGGGKEEVISEILRAVYIPPGIIEGESETVLYVGSGTYAGALWSLSVEEAPVISCEEAPLGEEEVQGTASMSEMQTKLPPVLVTDMIISPSERFCVIGFQDGNVWLIPFANMGVHYCVQVADSSTGMVTSVGLDLAENLLSIGAGDGTLSTVALSSDGVLEVAAIAAGGQEYDAEEVAVRYAEAIQEPIQTEADSWDLPFMDSPGLITVSRDINDASTYSIQDAKLKSEEDNAKAAAEQKKRRVLDKIAELRRELEDLQAKNANVACNKLTPAELTIDIDYIEHLHKDMEIQVKEVRRQLAWQVEFHERGMQKLRDFYLGRLDFERVEVLAFRSPHRVATFRCPAMSAELQTNLARLHELIFAADKQTDDEDDEGGFNDGTRTGDPFRDTGAGGFGNTTGFGDGSVDFEGSGEAKPLSGAELREQRRQDRQLRKQQMAELEKAKPSDSYEDPQDVEAIAHAEATLGNYMLKTSDDYQVPENQRMNAEKKRRQMFLLEESVHAIKTEFNHRVLALRDFRQQVRHEVKRDLAALAEIDQQLGTDTVWIKGLLDDPAGAPKEFPERRFEMTEADLKAYVQQLTGQPAESEKAEDENDEDEELDEDEEGEEDEEAEEQGGEEDGDPTGSKQAKALVPEQNVPTAGRAAVAARRIGRLTTRAGLLQEADGGLGKAVFEEAQARLWHDKAQLEEHIRQVVDTFNSAVASIEKEKAKLESDLKNADMKLLVLYEELLTLNALEERDEALLQKATKCRNDKTKIMHQIKECQDQLGEKKVEIEQWHNEEQALQAEFTELVGENSPFLGQLLKIYKKKVKRTKRKKPGEEEELDEEEEDEEDESDLDSEEEDDDMEEDVGPPQGCDVQIYESVIDLREKRLDMEDALQEIQKAVEELKRTHKKLLDDERRIDKEQKQTDNEIQQFQTDKQRKLNQVQIVFALRLSQVQCLDGEEEEEEAEEHRLPAELHRHVVFTHEGLHRLMNRITQLHQEIKEVKANFKQLQRDFKQRKKEQKQATENIEDLNVKFQDIQMLKFGQIVDLELIESTAPNKYVQELQEKVNEAEREHRKRIAEWDKRIEKQKKEMTKITAENTSLMDQIVSMGYSQMQLDAALNARIANVTVNDTEPLMELREMERERLKDLLTLQSKEIATLQAEINLFRRKGGHIYTTVTANR